LHEISNDNGVEVVNFATSKNPTVKRTKFPNRNIHKYIWASPNLRTHNQIDHILLHRQRHSNLLDVRLFMAADCDNCRYLMVANVRGKLAMNKQISHRLRIRDQSREIKQGEGKERHRVEVSNRFATKEDFRC
jgi:hypothetical protein